MEDMDRNWNYRDLYECGVRRLEKAGVPEAELNARLLLEWVCKTDRNTLLVRGDRNISEEEYLSYVNCISHREMRKPLQYITGYQEFMGLEFEVDENVLIPRQDTEILVEEVLRHLHDGMRILDMCTGSGCILLSLLYYSNDCSGLGVDISDAALNVARRNAKRLDSLRNGINAKFVQGDLFRGLGDSMTTCGVMDEEDMCAGMDTTDIRPGMDETDICAGAGGRITGEASGRMRKFEIIVSNPPYIKRDEISSLMPEVKEYEPYKALDGGDDGLYFYREIIKNAGAYLTGGGELFLEIGCEQGADVKSLMEAAGYGNVEIIKDYAGLDRVVYGIN